MAKDVTLALTQDEAIVLLEWLSRFNVDGDCRFEDQAEQRVLWDLEASLESMLSAPLKPDYAETLARARARLRDPAG